VSLVLAAVLTVAAAPATLPQGGVAEIRVASNVPVAALELVDGDRRVPLERDASGRTFHGLLGLDVEATTGPRPVVVESPGGEERLVLSVGVSKGRFRVQKLSVDPKYVEVPPEERERVKEDAARVTAAYRSAELARRWTSFARPLEAEGRNFGARRVYNGATRSIHSGLDIPAPMGTPVVAAAEGRVALAGDLYFSGGTVLLDHGGGLFTQYMHLSRVDVKEGDVLARGQEVGLVGATGRVTGPHLHWGARLNGARIDPEGLLRLKGRPAPAPRPAAGPGGT
jgi:murein DD-endopeptidase MepM/ murein hydrolase activator NlpD